MRNVQVVLAVSFFIYGGMVFFGVLHHEPWRDEAHVWVSAREDSIGQMVESVRYAPTPLAWQILLVPFARIGFPYMTMNVLHAILAIVAVGLLLRFGKIPVLTKILFMFSYYMAYEYAVIARNYVLTIVSLWCIATLYDKRLAKPILYGVFVSLLFQTNVYSAAPAAALFVSFCWDVYKRKKITLQQSIAVILMIATGVFTFILYVPNSQLPNPMIPENALVELRRIMINAIASPLFMKFIVRSPEGMNMGITTLTGIVFVGFFVTMVRKKAVLLMAGATSMWLFLTNVFLQRGTLRHHGLFLVYMVFFLWISSRRCFASRIMYGGLHLLLFLSMASTIYVYAMEYRYDFSGSRDMARFIASSGIDRETVVMYTASDGEAILPYIPGKQFWYPEYGEFSRYHINDGRNKQPWLTWYEITTRVRKQFRGTRRVYFILSSPLVGTDRTGYTLLHSSLSKSFWANDTENYWVYKAL